MRRKGGTDISSFELLLDTMCNTFGGIVFIALLLALLSNATKRASSASSRDNAARLELQSVEQIMRMDRLRQQIDQLRRSLELRTSATLRTHSGEVNRTELLATVESNRVTATDNESLRTECQGLAETNAVLRRELEMASITETELRQQATRLGVQLDAATNRTATRTLRLPRLHVVSKMPVFIAVKAGRIHQISDLTSGFHRTRTYTDKDVILEEGPDLTVVTPRANGGVRVDDRLWKAWLENVDAGHEYASVAVYLDSFAEFNILKDALVRLGIEYNWTPCDGSVSIVRNLKAVEAQ